MVTAQLGHWHAAFGLTQDRKDLRLCISACLHSESPRSSCRENSTSAAPTFGGITSALYLDLGGATADATNRLSINAPASRFIHAGAGHQIKLNMAAATDIGPFLSHTGFSGRAEYGLSGSDDFQIKVSADGTTRFNALQLERTSGPGSRDGGAATEPECR